MNQMNVKSKGKERAKSQNPPNLPSSNWLALQKKLSGTKSEGSVRKLPKKKRKLEGSVAIRSEDGASNAGSSRSRSRALSVDSDVSASFARGHGLGLQGDTLEAPTTSSGKDKESVEYLRKMVLGQLEHSEGQKQPGKYIAIDCEMVGVGLDGSESSLARVSLVNYHGVVILDEFVRQRERVVDYRTFVSGVRETDMIKAKPFAEIQKRVAGLLKDRILVGHAVFNDLKALLLSHPRPLTRDTQFCAGKAKLLKTKYPALRRLVQHVLGIEIQGGEHSSVTDARATMAVYRLHKKEWDKGFRPLPVALANTKKRKAPDNAKDDRADDSDLGADDVKTVQKLEKKEPKRAKDFPGGGQKGVSSGLSTVIKRPGRQSKKSTSKGDGKKANDKWWATLNPAPPKGAKGSIRLSSAL